jgi:hypothetical protein
MSLKVDIRAPAYLAYLMRSQALVNMSATLSVPGMYPNTTKQAAIKFPDVDRMLPKIEAWLEKEITLAWRKMKYGVSRLP